jgi:predicted ATPase
MIEQIEIGNFRAFSKPVSIRLRPLTVLIGKNSAGKSTFLKLLLMIRQTLESRGGGFLPQFFVSEGTQVRLGALEHLQNRNPGFAGKRLQLKMRLRTSEGPSASMLNLLDALQHHESGGQNGVNVTLPSPDKPAKVLKEKTVFEIEAEVLYRKPEVGYHAVTASQGDHQLFQFKSQSLRDVRFLFFPSNTSRPEGELEAVARNTFLRPAQELLVAPRHLSPVREDLQPVLERSTVPADEVGHHGEYAYQHLYDLLNQGGDRADFVSKSIRRIANVDQLQFEARAREFQAHFQGRNRDTGARCHLRDFGFGVGQCIPIFVQGALLQRGQLLMVEQPEAQLHPTAQLELGSFFVELWRTFGVPSIVETHSDNLILRLRKLVKTQKLAPSDVSIAYFSVENRTVIVKNLDILEDGRLGKGLPMEFFGADLLEVLEMQ